MSLVCWLPLNGNLNNQGFENITVVNNGATVNNSGKIGKCYSFDGSDDYISLTSTSLYNTIKGGNVPFSISMWVYRADETRAVLFGDYGLSGEIKFNLELTTSNVVRFYWSASPDLVLSSAVLTPSSWNHLTITYDGTCVKCYINGELKQSSNIVLNSMTKSSGAYYLGRDNRTGTTAFNGKMNDFRIYDHALSSKEVSELAKGMVCHYKLSNQYETGQINKYSGSVAEGDLSNDSFTKTKLENERGYNYKLTYTGNGNNRWPSMNAGSTFSFTIGKKYYYSCKVRCHSANFSFSLRAARSSNDWVTSSTNVLQRKDGEWHEYYVAQTINETYNRSGTTVTCNPILEFYSESLSTADKVYSADFDIKDIQVIESDCYVPFIDNSMISTVVSDCSGCGNNGAVNGNIAWSGDSARYSGSYKFPTTSYIDCGTGGKVTDEITVNIWCYMDTWATDPHPISCTESGGWNFESNSGKIQFPVYIKDSGYITATSSKLWTDLASGWHMFTGTYDGYNAKLYIDGELEKTTSNGKSNKTDIGYHSTNHIYIHAESTYNSYSTGYKECNLSDCRIYATALSAEDIKALYSTSASIDRTGILYAYEFVEEG